jgi:5-methylcytosine-specific restriction endonuclease McrA
MRDLSSRFKERLSSLWKSQVNRSREKTGPSGRVSRKGYVLPFDQKQFVEWFLNQFGGNEGAAIRCCYCNRPVDAYSCHVDHKMPLKRGGSPGLDNLALPCSTCNSVKGQLTPEEFKDFLDSMVLLGNKHGQKAVTDIMSRLEKAVKLAAGMRFNIMQRQKQAEKDFHQEEPF